MEDKRLESALEVLKILNESGYEAYLVGGFVRDYLLGTEGKDIDITTNALPQKVQELFPNNYSKSLKFKTITVRNKGYEFEVTTYRIDKRYKDHRHPESKVSASLKEDVKRRDFTVNAICMDKDLKTLDYVGGINDLRLQILRAVGNPKKRFNEDALRMFRAFRFASRLGFKIEEETYKGIVDNANLVKFISKERIKQELEGTIETASFKNILPLMIDSDIFKTMPDLLEAFRYLKENYIPCNLMDILCLASYLKGEVTDELILSKKERKFVSDTLHFMELLKHRKLTPMDLFECDFNAVKEASKILVVGRQTPYNLEDLEDLFESLPIKKQKELKVNGDDVISILDITDPTKIKEYLYLLCSAVVHKKVKNTEKDLINYLKGIGF